MLDEVCTKCDRDVELYKEFSGRLRKVVSNTDGIGWGFQEGLEDSFYSIGWYDVEDED